MTKSLNSFDPTNFPKNTLNGTVTPATFVV
jgi:hypothetical protein